MTTLLACPLCGGDACIDIDCEHSYAKCLDCECFGPARSTAALAAEAWNKRAPPLAGEEVARVAKAIRSATNFGEGGMSPSDEEYEHAARAAIGAMQQARGNEESKGNL